jgi:hypothetical protein
LGSSVDEFSPFSWAKNSGVRLHEVEQRREKESAFLVTTRIEWFFFLFVFEDWMTPVPMYRDFSNKGQRSHTSPEDEEITSYVEMPHDGHGQVTSIAQISHNYPPTCPPFTL